MDRRGLLGALSSTITAVTGCGSRDREPSRTPYEAPPNTVAASDRTDGSYAPVTIDAPVSVATRFEGVPCPTVESTRARCYHDLDSRPEAYLAPRTERVAPAADGTTFVAFNRSGDDLRLEYADCSLYRWTDPDWEPVALASDPDRPALSIPARGREPAALSLPFAWSRAGAGGLPGGIYAFVVPAEFDRSDARRRYLGALFVVEPQAAMRDDGRLLARVRVENDPPVVGDRGAISAELRRAATTAHPARVRVRLRCFERAALQGSIPVRRSTASGADGSSRLELAAATSFRDGCWRATASKTDVELVTNTVTHGDELSVDLELGTPDETCPDDGRYRFDEVFRLSGSSLETGFSIVYESATE